MANGDAFDDAVARAREADTLDIGCHLVLVGGRSLATGRPYPRRVPQLLAALVKREMDPYREMEAQVRRILDAGLRPSHLDTHKHTHLAPPVLDAVARIAREFGIAWVRRPFDFPMGALAGVPRIDRLTSAGLGLLRGRFHRVLARAGCRTTDHFAGFQITGRFRAAGLVKLLAMLPSGSTELMCHPGYCTEALRHAPTRLKESREEELRALTAPEVRAAIEKGAIALVNYAGISPTR
jgi:chitin disaccharide deacetylase